MFCTHITPRRWTDFAVVLRLARVHKVPANAPTVQDKSSDETVSFWFVVFCAHITPRRWADSMVVLRLARDHNVPVDVSVARGLLPDETVSF